MSVLAGINNDFNLRLPSPLAKMRLPDAVVAEGIVPSAPGPWYTTNSISDFRFFGLVIRE